MAKAEQSDDSWLELFSEARVATLATVNQQGRIDLVPCTFAVDGRWIYSSVDHKPKRNRELQRLKNVLAFPEVTMLAQHYDDANWDELWWVRVRGRASVRRGNSEMRPALDLLIERYPQYQEVEPCGPVIAVDVTEVKGWRAKAWQQPSRPPPRKLKR